METIVYFRADAEFYRDIEKSSKLVFMGGVHNETIRVDVGGLFEGAHDILRVGAVVRVERIDEL